MKFNNKVLIVGCGAITSTFHLPALQKLIAKNNIFLYDKNFNSAKILGNIFGINNIIKNLDDGLSNVDSSILAVPYQYSFNLTKKLLSSGIHVLGEKPIASSSEDLKELIALSKAKNLTFCGNHTRRFFPSIIKLKKLLQDKKIKEINIYEGDPFSWNSKSGFYFEGSNGVLMDRGPHIINVINFITNHIELNPISFNHNAQSGLPESHCKIFLKSKNFDVNIIISWIYKMSNQIEVITDNEIFQVGISSFNFINQYKKNNIKNITAKPIKTQFNQFSDNVIEEFLKHVNCGTSNSVLATDIHQSVDLIEKLYSIGTNFNEK